MHFLKYKYLFIALLFTVIGAFFNFYTSKEVLSEKQAKKVQKVVNEKEKRAEELCSRLINLSDTSSFETFETFRLNEEKKLANRDIQFFVFENRQLLYWSNNVISSHYLLQKNNSKLFFSGNAWYLLTYKKTTKREYFVLSLIKNQYPFENEYISNTFQKDFDLDESVEIFEDPCDSFSINDIQGDFLMAIAQNNAVCSEKEYSFQAMLCYLIAFVFLLLFCATIPQKNTLARFCKNSLIVALGLFLCWHSKILTNELSYQLFNQFTITVVIAYFVFTFKNCCKYEYLYHLLFVIISFCICGTATGFIKALGSRSDINLELYNLLSTNIASFLAYFIEAFLLFIYFVFVFKYAKSCEFQKKHSFTILLLFCVLFPFCVFLLKKTSDFYGNLTGFFLVSVIPIVSLAYLKKIEEPKFFLKLIFLIISVIYVEATTSLYLNKKNDSQQQTLAVELANEQDPVAESLLSSVYKSTRSDKKLDKLMKESDNKDVEIKEYLQKTYFGGMLKQYELECTVCGTDSVFSQTNQLSNCEKYFKQKLLVSGKSISDTNYYYVNNQDGNITYFDSIQFNLQNGAASKLYIELHSKQTSQDYGYPKILLDNDVTSKEQTVFSSAKYKNGILVSKRGKCPYSQKLALKTDETFTTVVDEQHHVNHLIYKINEQYSVIVSRRTLKWTNYLMWFPYIFLIFFVLLLIFERCFFGKRREQKYSLSNQIRTSLVGLLIGSFFIVIIGGIAFVKARNDRQQQNFLEEKIHAVAKEFSLFYQDYGVITKNEQSEIQNILTDLANIHSVDINFYDADGNLIASSRPEIFQFKLVNEKMTVRAFYQLIEKNRMSFSHETNIENLHFMSSYYTITNSQNQVLGYLNLPNFSNQEEFKQQFAGLIVGLLNLLVILLIFATILSVFIARKISTPLIALQNKMKNVSIGAENEKINIKAPEELHGLLENYNTMIEQLSVSADKLAKAEREMAWREMARQIAHEIKNPLTPMKLSIQLLNRSWDEKDEKFEKRLKSISKTIIEQIDTLADTATSFSDFAKLSKVVIEPININELLQNCAVLFNQEENIVVSSNLPEKTLFVLADKEKTMRLFNNLVKNAVQAIPSGKQGEIELSLNESNDFALIAVKDNGRGIDTEAKEHIFELHFTTKSTGSGFGLAICKNIVESCHGEIWYETQVDVGTTFFVKLPLQKE
ncbi:MAG: HAMP domain-containing histidine kinase [Bacteroidales bacterium]|nr:HAMP domain-containing histidine kinase [Bacteroidales bacterium]